MNSGKPQTRGLAALLRVEKERRAREATAEEESTSPSPERVEDRDGPRAIVAPAVAKGPTNEPAEGSVAEESPASLDEGVTTGSISPETSAGPAEGGPAPAASEAQRPDDATATIGLREGLGSLHQTEATGGRLSPSPFLPRRASARAPRVSRKGVAAPAEPTTSVDPGWQKFMADWKPFLRQGVKFKLCEFFYRNTVAVGRREFTTSTAQLSRVAGAHRRHIFLVLRQLEEFRFIRKESVETNRRDEGLVIYFFPDRQA